MRDAELVVPGYRGLKTHGSRAHRVRKEWM